MHECNEQRKIESATNSTVTVFVRAWLSDEIQFHIQVAHAFIHDHAHEVSWLSSLSKWLIGHQRSVEEDKTCDSSQALHYSLILQ